MDQVRLRTGPLEWGWRLAFALFCVLGPGLDHRMVGWWRPFWFAMAAVFVLEALTMRTFGVDLRPDAAVLRGVRRRVIPWSSVTGVEPVQAGPGSYVRLHCSDGRAVALRAPRTFLWTGLRRFNRDYHRIGQWWLAHRQG